MNVSIKGVWRTVGAAALALGMSSQAQAATISFNTGGSAVSIPGLTGFQTFGDDMTGMTVTAFFNNDPTGVSAIWAATGAGAGAATSGADWSLALSGEASYQPVELHEQRAGAAHRPETRRFHRIDGIRPVRLGASRARQVRATAPTSTPPLVGLETSR